MANATVPTHSTSNVQELEAGNRIHDAELALEAEEAQTRRLTAKLDAANVSVAHCASRCLSLALPLSLSYTLQ